MAPPFNDSIDICLNQCSRSSQKFGPKPEKNFDSGPNSFRKKVQEQKFVSEKNSGKGLSPNFSTRVRAVFFWSRAKILDYRIGIYNTIYPSKLIHSWCTIFSGQWVLIFFIYMFHFKNKLFLQENLATYDCDLINKYLSVEFC